MDASDDMSDPEKSSKASESSILDRSFEVMRSFNAARPVQTVTEISRATNLPKSTVHRLLSRLIELGAIERHRSAYRIGLEILRIGSLAPVRLVRDLALGHMIDLASATEAAVHFGVLRAQEVRFVEVLAPAHCSWPTMSVGEAQPAYLTALGKSILAHSDLEELKMQLPPALSGAAGSTPQKREAFIPELRRIRRDGVAISRDQAKPGLTCLGISIVSHGFPVVGLSIGFPSTRKISPKWIEELKTAALRITSDYAEALEVYPEIIFPKDR